MTPAALDRIYGIYRIFLGLIIHYSSAASLRLGLISDSQSATTNHHTLKRSENERIFSQFISAYGIPIKMVLPVFELT